ncbi:2Fe-2S iron-sulfur cluster-binding protein [Bradyrhizobium liaoningense]|uniref:2Fe-2S iron-sulfur cluster-binding protein n=1 Tax=Bradyrhizobium liaoningense TaxID=43992 RepID=UPI001BAB571D|nr:2Fe-2S iron-sulfur cluster-binding protein [Bradyrhizobium liaoningense]MBR0706946.1 2Fe-2S iron-sulfur cluster binding domain-containing protein [Bradyrhizobium liaoningense]
MPVIVYVEAGGQRTRVEVEAGANVMRTAVHNGIGGIVGECGGAAMCATCHVYIEDEGAETLPPVGEVENEMLESAAAERLQSSRLSCQLNVTGNIETLVVRIPDRQL